VLLQHTLAAVSGPAFGEILVVASFVTGWAAAVMVSLQVGRLAWSCRRSSDGDITGACRHK